MEGNLEITDNQTKFYFFLKRISVLNNASNLRYDMVSEVAVGRFIPRRVTNR